MLLLKGLLRLSSRVSDSLDFGCLLTSAVAVHSVQSNIISLYRCNQIHDFHNTATLQNSAKASLRSACGLVTIHLVIPELPRGY